jgi:hypothetical protein
MLWRGNYAVHFKINITGDRKENDDVQFKE